MDKEFKPNLNWETEDYGWFDLNDIPSPKHFGLQKLLSDRKSIDTINYYINKFRGISEVRNVIKKAINEIRLTPVRSDFHILKKRSRELNGGVDYSITFKSKSDKLYVVDLDAYVDEYSPFPEEILYNIAFTSLEQSRYSVDDKYEEQTNRNEMLDVMSRIMYIIIEIKKIISANFKPIFVIGETNNPQKINIYRNLIKNSLPNFKEYYGDGLGFEKGKAYYYY